MGTAVLYFLRAAVHDCEREGMLHFLRAGVFHTLRARMHRIWLWQAGMPPGPQRVLFTGSQAVLSASTQGELPRHPKTKLPAGSKGVLQPNSKAKLPAGPHGILSPGS